MNVDQILEWAWDKGDIVALGALFIWALVKGHIRLGREFKQLEEVNQRLAAVISENSRTTEEAAKTTEKAIHALNERRAPTPTEGREEGRRR